MRVLLADPPYRVSYKKYIIPNLGLAYLAAVLRDAGHEVEAFSASLHRDPYAAFAEHLARWRPDWLGLSAPTCKIVQAARLAGIAKENNPEVQTVIGGWHMSAAPEQTMADYPVFDFGIDGEAEAAIVALVGGEDPHGIGGAYHRQDGAVVAPREPITPPDLDALPRPAWDLFDLNLSRPMYRDEPGALDYPLMAKRGCPFNCLFCKKDNYRTVRFRNVEDVVAEMIEAVERWGADGIQFFDETFTLDRRHIVDLCEAIIAAGLPARLRWNAATRFDCVDRELIHLMRRANCRVLQFGAESGSEHVLRANRKNTTLAQARDAVAWCREAGIESDVSFIFGMPYDDRRSVLDTARFSRELNPDFVAYFTFIPYPGTPAGDLAAVGEANLRVLHRDYENYEQQYSLPAELQDYPAWRLTWLRLFSYARFYFRPGKWRRLRTMLDLSTLPIIFIDLVGNLRGARRT
ncbi:MAG: radical SAM protein [Candidatus Lernaella stagnicola]|nr:radical SAM protein [Candidatus Lernaella stagnicola]